MSGSAALARLLDDASQFPPGNLPLAQAWPAHRRWRQDQDAKLVGRFLLPSGRAAALAALIGDVDDDGIELGIVVSAGSRPDVLGDLEGAAPVSAVELRGSIEEVGAWRQHAPEAFIFIEGVPVLQVAELRRADSRIAAKVRCGGLEADAFPIPAELAAFLRECVRLDVPFKATAGLHGALRHWDPEIGVHHHGFMNLWTATALAARDAKPRELVRCLEVEEPDGLARFGVSVDELERARRWFTGFGTCSIEEPLEGLAAAGLLHG